VTDYFYTAQLTVPAKRAITNPLIQQLTLQDAILDRMQVRVPAGHTGLTGIAVLWSGAQIWPTIPGTWTSGDNELFEWEYGKEVTAAGLQLSGYNTDVHAHTFYARFWLSNVQPVSPIVIASPQLANAPGAATVAAVAGLTGFSGARRLAGAVRQLLRDNGRTLAAGAL
jgi:hypothetical protein